MTAAWAVIALIAAMLTQQSGREAAAGNQPTTVLSEDEAAAGLVALGETYPGGFAALIAEFETGACADLASYDEAVPSCQAILDQVAALGAGQSAPETIPDLAGETDPTVYPPEPRDPSDDLTTEWIDWMEAEGAPADLIAALRQDPPVLPPEYDTWGTQGGGPAPSGSGIGNEQSIDTTAPIPTDTTAPTATTSYPYPTTTTTLTATTTAAPPPPPPPPNPLPLVVAVGDSPTSGHVSAWGRTTCDDPLTAWVNNLRIAIGTPLNRYFNFAHSGATTADVIGTLNYTNPCGVVSQVARPQLADATALLRANPSVRGWANVAVFMAGVNDTNWTPVARQLVGRRLGGRAAVVFGATPNWAVANPGACRDWTFGNPAGNPGAPPGAIPPAWNGVAVSGGITIGVARIALGLISADPGAQVRQLLYYRWTRDPNLPVNCGPAAIAASTMLNDWGRTGIVIAKIVWGFFGGDARRIRAVCEQMWFGVANVQTRIFSLGRPNWALVPGWPHPTAAGNGVLSGCVNGTLPRFPGAGIA